MLSPPHILMTPPTGMLLSAFGYAGEWTDSDTGYSYLRMRWLDALTGTFLSEDPLIQSTNNAFGYTEGNPITQIDPLGLMSIGTTPVLPPSSEVNKAITNALLWTRRNSGYIALGLGVSAVAAVAITPIAPAAPVLYAAGTMASVLSLEYEIANCVGYTNDKSCDVGALILSGTGVLSGGIAIAGGKLGLLSMNRVYDFDAAAFVAGVLGVATALGVMIIKRLNNIANKEEEDC